MPDPEELKPHFNWISSRYGKTWRSHFLTITITVWLHDGYWRVRMGCCPEDTINTRFELEEMDDALRFAEVLFDGWISELMMSRESLGAENPLYYDWRKAIQNALDWVQCLEPEDEPRTFPYDAMRTAADTESTR